MAGGKGAPEGAARKVMGDAFLVAARARDPRGGGGNAVTRGAEVMRRSAASAAEARHGLTLVPFSAQRTHFWEDTVGDLTLYS